MKIIKNNKILYLEIMRIIAIFFVIFNHTNKMGYLAFMNYSYSDLRYWLYMFVSIFCKFSVPLFFMISGALYLEKEHSFNYILKKIGKIFLVLIFASIFYYLMLNGIQYFDLKIFIYKFISSTIGCHLWYLYSYLLFLALLPFLQMFVKKMQNYHYYHLIGIYIILSVIIPIVEYFCFNKQYIITWNLSGITNLFPCFYAIIGYFLNYRFSITKKKIIYLWIINIILIMITQALTYLINDKNIDIQTYFNTFKGFNSATIFVTIKYIFTNFKFDNYLRKIIESLGNCCFGIYIIHVLILERLFNINLYDNFYIAFVKCFIVMGISYIIVLVLKRIPLINKLI